MHGRCLNNPDKSSAPSPRSPSLLGGSSHTDKICASAGEGSAVGWRLCSPVPSSWTWPPRCPAVLPCVGTHGRCSWRFPGVIWPLDLLHVPLIQAHQAQPSCLSAALGRGAELCRPSSVFWEHIPALNCNSTTAGALIFNVAVVALVTKSPTQVDSAPADESPRLVWALCPSPVLEQGGGTGPGSLSPVPGQLCCVSPPGRGNHGPRVCFVEGSYETPSWTGKIPCRTVT